MSMIECPHIILRDGESLPKKSGFDIDLLIIEGGHEHIIEICKKCAEDNDVVMINNGKKIALFYLSYNSNYRNYAIIDIQTTYKYGNKSMGVEEMLELPTKDRETLIKNVQLARKGLASPEVQETLDIKPYKKNSTERCSFLQKVKRTILIRAFFIHLHTMPFIVISGPDGVGKTTLLTNIIRLLDSLPLNTACFHHTGLGRLQKQPEELPEDEMGIYRILRRKYTPKIIKSIYGSITAEIKYAIRINREVLNNFYGGTLTFSDRYIYDRAVKMRMLPDKLLVAKITTKINTYLMRKPTVMVIPVDTAEAIFKRKQELQITEIRQYYDSIIHVFRARKLPCIHKVDVSNKTPEDLAIETTRKILVSLTPVIFRAIGMYEKGLKRK